ncbi:hypothetical protein P692DRAFT_201226806 [Suillus brevipes Sb2]|nr:hypothetical protein P692DRAFT_201226806 [Suillus brevipes Sb2]
MHERQRKLLNSEFPEKWTIPHAYSTLSLGSRSRNFHGICSPRTRSPTTGTFHRIVNHTFTTKCNDDTIVHSPCFRCATRMRTRIDCQGSHIACVEGGNWYTAVVLHADGRTWRPHKRSSILVMAGSASLIRLEVDDDKFTPTSLTQRPCYHG